MKRLTFIFTTVLANIAIGTSLECYLCQDVEGSNCYNGIAMDVTDCHVDGVDSENLACLSYIDGDTMHRHCSGGTTGICEYLKEQFEVQKCETCQDTKCNGKKI